MLKFLSETRARLEHFFYAQEVPYGLALVRITLPIVMMSMILPRWAACREIYSSDGAPAPLPYGYGYPDLIPILDGPTTVALFSLLTLTLFTISIGYCTRLSLVVCSVLYAFFCNLDAISTMTKYSVISSHVLLLLACSNCGKLWSVDAWLSKRAGLQPDYPMGPAWPRRCLQLMIGLVYFGAAVTKMNTPTFLSGDQLHFWMMTHINFRHPVGELLSLYPILLKMMSYVALVWEVTFVFLVWRGQWRPWVLAIGILFHFMTVLTLGLMIFPMVCFSCYLGFMDEHDFGGIREWWTALLAKGDAWARGIQRVFNAMPAPGAWQKWSGGAYAAVGPVFMLAAFGGLGLEYWLDRYGDRRAEGRYTLKEVDPDLMARMLAPTPRIRDIDKFFAVDTGTILVGDLLADRRRVFRHGETLIMQCNLTPPHEDMWIECKVLDGDNRLVSRVGNIALREQFRSNFTYPITAAMEPGEYTFRFETAGREVLRKTITVVGDTRTANAN
ncbi:MAG TPA: HTTM domain-containing protein [Planctomycetaceae bacterium]|nr:HTTM domain-containing protein [Planctomycetaceae bacterium]